jgi:chromosome segregation ATPase
MERAVTQVQTALDALHAEVAAQVRQADREVKDARADSAEARRELSETLTRLRMAEAQLERYRRFTSGLRKSLRTGPVRSGELLNMLDVLEAGV